MRPDGMMDVGMGLITDPLEAECDAIRARLRSQAQEAIDGHATWEPRPVPPAFRLDRLAERQRRAIDPLMRRRGR